MSGLVNSKRISLGYLLLIGFLQSYQRTFCVFFLQKSLQMYKQFSIPQDFFKKKSKKFRKKVNKVNTPLREFQTYTRVFKERCIKSGCKCKKLFLN